MQTSRRGADPNGSPGAVPDDSDDVVAETSEERSALEAVNAYMRAFNARDVAGTDAALHFPHVRLASGTVRVLKAPDSVPPDFFARFAAEHGWACSRWDYRRAVQSCADKVHFAVQFTRYRSDGSVIGHYPSMWIVTLRDDRWGIQARSSFAP
jgi:hypothetical protein